MVNDADINAVNEIWARGLALYAEYSKAETSRIAVAKGVKERISLAERVHGKSVSDAESAYRVAIAKADSVHGDVVDAANEDMRDAEVAASSALEAYKSYVAETGMPDLSQGVKAGSPSVKL